MSDREPTDPVGAVSLTGRIGVLAPVVIALIISVFFVTLFLLAFRSPTPHDLAVGVVGAGSSRDELRHTLDARTKGALDLRDYADAESARDGVEHRDVYAAIVVGRDAWTLVVAGANGSAVTPALERELGPAATAAGASLIVQDVVHAHRGTRPAWRSSMPRSAWSSAASSSVSTPTRLLRP